MKELEKFLKLKEEIQNEKTNAARLEAEYRRLQDEYPVLESQFIEADDPKLSADIEKRMAQVKSRLEELPLLIKKSKRRAELLEEKLSRAEEEAIRNLRDLYRPKLNSLVQTLVKKWREVAEIEKQIRGLKNQADMDLAKITSAPRILLPHIPLFFVVPDEGAVAVSVSGGPYCPFTRMKKLIEALAREGFDVSPKETD